MRISDWSSDVCSSDLRFVRFANIVARNSGLFCGRSRRPVARLGAFPHRKLRQGRSDAMTGIGQVLIVNFIGLIVAILGLWAGARAIRDVSFVDAIWPLGMVLPDRQSPRLHSSH